MWVRGEGAEVRAVKRWDGLRAVRSGHWQDLVTEWMWGERDGGVWADTQVWG